MELLKKNLTHLKNLWNYIKYIFEHIICIIIILIILIICGFILTTFQTINPDSVESQQIMIYGISLDNWVTWYTMIGLIITAIWSIYQYSKNVLRKQQQGASKIAQDFADNLIERMGIISDVLMDDKNFSNIIKKIDTSKLKEFTDFEMKKNINIKNYFDIFNKVVYSKETQKKYEEILKETYNEKEIERFESDFALLVENTLNKLEALCINISSKAAGSQFIYESLHQVFLSTIEVLSIKIAGTNTNNINKYYTNIISVYNMWSSQRNNDIEKLNKTSKKIEKLKNKAEKEIEKLLNKQTKTV